VRTEPGLIVFELAALPAAEPAIKTLRLFHVPVPPQAEVRERSTHARLPIVRGGYGAEPNVLGQPESSGGSHGGPRGCHISLTRWPIRRDGQYAARFTATCNDEPGGGVCAANGFPRRWI